MARDINDIVWRGYGSWSDVNGVPTKGYGSATSSIISGPYSVQQREIFSPGAAAAEIGLPGTTIGEIGSPGTSIGEIAT